MSVAAMMHAEVHVEGRDTPAKDATLAADADVVVVTTAVCWLACGSPTPSAAQLRRTAKRRRHDWRRCSPHLNLQVHSGHTVAGKPLWTEHPPQPQAGASVDDRNGGCPVSSTASRHMAAAVKATTNRSNVCV